MDVSTVPAEKRTDIIPNKSMSYHIVKRTFDIAVSFVGLILLSPVMVAAAAAIYIDDRGPVIFSQYRNGLNGKPFKMYKFRSMRQDAPQMRIKMEDQNELDGPAFKMKNDPRITRAGHFLRKTSIDELPQLINILKGDMSVVGPRPLPTYETERLNTEQKRRLLVKPGLTCYWQVSGRNEVSFNEWMEMDYRYITEQSFRTDLKIFLRTIPAVLHGEGY